MTIDVAPAEEESTLKEIFDYLGSSEKRSNVAIDEFQQITEYQEKGVEALLRSYVQFLPNVNFIFAGSKQHLMQEMFTSSKRLFYQSTQPLAIGPIPRDEYARFATALFAGRNLKLPDEAFHSIYEKYEGHTWYVQCLLNRLYGYNRNVDRQLVAYATKQIISEYSYTYAEMSYLSFIKFNKHLDFPFSDIDVLWLKRDELWMKEQNLSVSTISTRVRHLRAVFNLVIAEHSITPNRSLESGVLYISNDRLGLNKNILKFFLIQEKVYFCERDNLEYVKFQ